MRLDLTTLRSAPLLLVPFVALGCTSELPGEGGEGGGTSEAAVRAQFVRDVQPILEQSCAVCHGAGSAALYDGVRFMEPTATASTIYDALFEYTDLINTGDPLSSPLVTKGAHAGPAFTIEQLDVIRPWLEAVGELFDDGVSLFTDPITPSSGPNTYEFGAIGISQLEGARLHINFSLDSGILYLLSIEVEAGANALTLDSLDVGVIAGGQTEPRFASNNSFDGIVTEIAAGQRECLGSCSLIAGWIPSEDLDGAIQLVFGFKSINEGAGGGNALTCQDVDFFYDNVAPDFQGRACEGCHGTGGTSTVFLPDLASTDMATRQAQCDEVLIRTNIRNTEVEHSIISSASAGGHPDQGDLTTLRDQLTAFVANELAQ